MARIQNPQNEKGETLATNIRVDDVSDRVTKIEEIEIPRLEDAIYESKIDVENLDDTDFSPLGIFSNLSKIKFAGKYVNVVSDPDSDNDGIIVYINEDKSEPKWNGELSLSSPSLKNLYLYGIPNGVTDLEGNTQCSYTKASAGISDIVVKYEGPIFTLIKGTYTVEVSYKLNGVTKTKSIDLSEINPEKTDYENFVPAGQFSKDNFKLEYIVLGDIVAPNGKTPGNIEVSYFEYTIPSEELEEGQVKDISISFKHHKNIEFSSSSNINVYLWTTPENNTPSGNITLSTSITKTMALSGLIYHQGGHEGNKVVATINTNNLANGALSSNKIILKSSNFSTTASESEISLRGATKGYEQEDTKTYNIPNKFISWEPLEISAILPGVVGYSGYTIPAVSSIAWNVHPVLDSTESAEYFKSENERLYEDFERPWISEESLTAGQAVVQNGKLYHTHGDYKDGGTSTPKNYKDLEEVPCTFCRIFKDSSASGILNGFKISPVEPDKSVKYLLENNDIEIIVYPYINGQWSEKSFVANKIGSRENNGLASSTLDNGSIICELPKGYGTLASVGLRVEIKINSKTATVLPIEIKFDY